MGEVVEHEIFHIRKLIFGSVGGQEAAFRPCKAGPTARFVFVLDFPRFLLSA